MLDLDPQSAPSGTACPARQADEMLTKTGLTKTGLTKTGLTKTGLTSSFAFLLLAACHGVVPSPPEFFPAPAGPLQALPFSEAVAANGFLFVAGQLGNLPGSLELAPGGIDAEARQALANMQAVLERHGASLRDVVKCTVFLADIAEWPAFNEVYRQYFDAPFPARSALAASGLALQARVEVECIAALPAAK